MVPARYPDAALSCYARTLHRRHAGRRFVMSIDYLQKILTAKVYDVAIESPLEPAPICRGASAIACCSSAKTAAGILVQAARRVQQDGATARRELKRGVIAASAGNHAQGVALAAQRLHCKAVIVMPVTTPRIKVDAVLARGAEVLLFGDSYDEAYRHALKLQKTRALTFVHPYDDPDVIAGQGTIGMEILRQAKAPIDAIFVAIGGGGLISASPPTSNACARRSGSSACSRSIPTPWRARSRPAGACAWRRSACLPTAWR